MNKELNVLDKSVKKRQLDMRWVMLRKILPVVIVCWLILCLVCYTMVDGIVTGQLCLGIEYAQQQQMTILNEQMDDLKRSLNNVARISIKHLYSYMHSVSYYQRYEDKQDILEVMEEQIQFNDRIADCLLFDLDAGCFLMGTSYLTKTQTEAYLNHLTPASSQGSYSVYTPLQESGGHHLAMGLTFNLGPSSNRARILAIVISSKPVELLLNTPVTGSGTMNKLNQGYSKLTDETGALLTEPEETQTQRIYQMSAANEYGLAIRYELPKDVFYSERDSAILPILLLMALGSVLVAGSILLLVNDLNKPIQKILRRINRMDVNHQPSAYAVNSTGVVEYNQILDHIDDANRRIGESMDKLLTVEKQKRHQQIMMLRMKINPHFLYNSLNAVQWMACSGECEKILAYMRCLLHILHYNLDQKNAQLVPLKEEIALVEDYLHLHHFRYEHDIDFTVNGITDEVKEVLVPRFILQPLVENSVYHGLNNGQGSITLDVLREGQCLILALRDNGRGIAPDVLERLREDEQQGFGIGLRYVQAILQECRNGQLTLNNIVEGNSICGTESIITLNLL